MVVSIMQGDARDAPQSHSLMHCVAADLRQGAGFAAAISEVERGREELSAQHLALGDDGVLLPQPPHRTRLVLALVTNRLSTDLPLERDFSACLEKVPALCVKNGVRLIACPFIGTGLDRLSRQFVMRELERVFGGTDISVTVYVLSPRVVPGDSVFGGSTLVGDSNLLRVLGPNTQCQKGHVMSGATSIKKRKEGLQCSLSHPHHASTVSTTLMRLKQTFARENQPFPKPLL